MLCQAKSRPGNSGFRASTPMKPMAAQILMEHTCRPVLKHNLDCLAQVRIISNHGHVGASADIMRGPPPSWAG